MRIVNLKRHIVAVEPVVPVNLPKATKELLETFRVGGTKFTHVVPAGKHHFRVENTIVRMPSGRTDTFLVAKVDGYGNIIAHGPFRDPPASTLKNYVVNADGDKVLVHD